MSNHTKYLEQILYPAIIEKGIEEVVINLNKYFTFENANKYATEYVKNNNKKETTDKVRQEKSSKDAVLGRLVEEVISIC